MADGLTLAGRTAIITGGNRGIGFQIAKKLLSCDMNVAIVGRDNDALVKAKKELQSNETAKCNAYKCDLRNISDIDDLFESVAKDFGGIDVVINNAGILDTSKIDTLTEEEWDNVLDTNLKSVFFVIQKSIHFLEKSTAPRIINISSNAGRMGGFENGLAYTASKGGMIALTYGAARRLAPKGITVNCIAPGTIETEMSDKGYDIETRKRLLNRFPIGRMGKPDDVASAVLFFASEESGFTTGAVLDVNGGLFMG